MNRILTLLLFLSNSVLAQVNLNQGLVAYYPFNGNANDASGNNNNPVFNNATLTSDRFGNPNSAYSFNGTNNYMQIPNTPTINPANQISICAWVKVNGFYQGPCHGNRILMKGVQDYQTGNYFLHFDDNGYTNGQNCSNPITDINHENFYGVNTPPPSGGYNPFIQTGQWYSVIYTSDGVTSKFYVNCQLKISTPANGITFSNPYDLFLGKLNDPNYPYWYNGVMDEVRIYNRAINEDEVNTLGGCVSNPISNIINNYTPVLNFDPCKNRIAVQDASAFNTGDTVLVIQMKGAIIDSSNSASFGTITDYKNSGNYEFNYVKSKTGNIIELKNALTRQYDIPDGKVQLVRVPYYQNANIISTLTCLPWDGSKGGVLVLSVQDSINLYSDIDVSGNGFNKGPGYNPQDQVLDCFQNDYNYPISLNSHAGQKGESITTISQNIICGKGAPASGGGGGLGHNSGGGGGGNAGAGGFGGYQLDNCGNAPFDNRGIGGHALTYNTPINKIFMGGGGGAGEADNINGPIPSGGNGGGIIILIGDKLKTNSFKIISNGDPGLACTATNCHDGMGGGGAGGSVLLDINQILDNSTVENKGGKGADMIGSVSLGGRIGPGGGGGGGLLFLNNSSLPANLTNVNTGGANGVLTTDANNPWGATPGQNGITLFNLNIPIDTALFKPNIDSVRINDSATGCKSFDFRGLGYTNTNPISSWQWFFGDGGTANTQNTSHTYATVNTFTVKLIITDINGCEVSMTRNVTTNVVTADAGPDSSFCSNTSVTTVLHGNGTGGNIFAWSPAIFLNDSTLQTPTATINNTTKFYLTISNGMNCTAIDSITITINPVPLVRTNNDTTFCAGGSDQLNAIGASSYIWSPATGLSNPNIANPIASPTSTTQYIVTGTNANGCVAKDSVIITINPKPTITKSNDSTICKNTSVQLFASGGTNYSWSPAATLNNPNIANPVATPSANTTYYVTVTSAINCSNNDSVKINIRPAAVFSISSDASTCFNTPIQLNAGGGDTYSWTPSNYLDNSAINNPHANPPSTTIYSVNIKESTCNDSTTLTTQVTILPLPTLQVTKQNDIDCSNDASQLNASGAVQYSWSPTGTLSNPNISNPVARPTSTTLYSVQGTDASGCTNTDTISVFVLGINKGGYLMANAFTPNNDGRNDCYGIKYWGIILELDFSIYNRWGERIFHTKTPGQCWDGTYRGIQQNPDVYVYMIKAKTTCDNDIFRKGTFVLIR